MTLRVAIAVIADPPIPGRCLPSLLAAHAASWASDLHAAMLRDTLDGLMALDAGEHLVLCPPDEDGEGKRVLERHAPAPWSVFVRDAIPASSTLEMIRTSPTGEGLALMVRAEAPSALIDPLIQLLSAKDAKANDGEDDDFVVMGPGERGDVWLYGGTSKAWALLVDLPSAPHEWAATIRVRCTKANMTLHELPAATIVDEPSAVLTLLEELRRHPERAPRTAHFVVTKG